MRSRLHSRAVLLELIDLTYAAAENDRLWQPFLQTLRTTVSARSAVLLHHDLHAKGGLLFSEGTDPIANRLYDDYFNRLDPFAAPAGRYGVGQPTTDEILVGRRELTRTEYYNDFAVGFDLARLLCVVVDQSETNSVLSILRAERDAPFESHDLRLVRALTPHVRRALQIHRRVQAANQERNVAVEALDALPCALFLVDATAKVLLANSRGSQMLAARDGVTTDAGRLAAESLADTKRVRDACGVVAAARASSTRHPGSAFTLGHRASGRLPLQVLVTPPTSPAPLGLTDDRVAALVFVSDPADPQRPNEQMLREFYGLTPAEADVAIRLTIGRRIEQIAVERGSAVETVRRQSKQILAKTGTRHRAELVHLLSTTLSSLTLGGGAA
jgi:DNA-binding CsgD family transcriptional regulator